MDPEPDHSSPLESWKDVEDLIRKQKIKLQDFGDLIQYLSKHPDKISLEFKCLVITLARETFRAYKLTDDAKGAQGMFRSKDKTNRSLHVANYATNKWLHDSFDQVKKVSSFADSGKEDDNMHLVVLQAGLQFMVDAFVIDNDKKLDVLKSKQGIDWEETTNEILRFAMSKKVNSLGHMAGLTKKHFASFRTLAPPGKSSSPDANNTAATSTGTDLSLITNSSLQDLAKDMAKQKRDLRIANLRRKAQSRTANTGSAAVPRPSRSTATATWGDTIIPAPATAKTWGDTPAATTAAWGNTPAAAPAASNRSGGWGSSPLPAPSNWGTSPALAPPQNWGDTPASAPAARTWGDTPAGAAPSWGEKPAPARTASHAGTWGGDMPAPAHAASHAGTWGDTPAPAASRSNTWGDSATPSGGGSSWGDQGKQSQPSDRAGWGNSTTQSREPTYDSKPSSYGRGGTTNGSSSSVNNVESGSADARGRSRGNDNIPGATANTAGSAHDNQTDGGFDRSQQQQQRNGPSSYNNDKRPHDQGPDRGSSFSDHRNNGNQKRPRQEQHPPRNPEPAVDGGGMGRGRGRGLTLPAWMTQKGNDGPQSSAGPQNNDHNGQPGSSSSAEVHSAPPPSNQLPPRGGGYNNSKPPPRNNPSHSRDPPAGGSGRGRGMTLPAWMTQAHNNDGPQGQQGPASSSLGDSQRAPSPTSAPLPPRGGNFQQPPPAGVQDAGRGNFQQLPPAGVQGAGRGNFQQPPPAGVQGAGRGRGRGMTLPAWMTKAKNNDGPQG
jgi:hypothetical protein